MMDRVWYTKSQIKQMAEWAKAPGITNSKMTKLFNKKYNTNISTRALSAARHKNGVLLDNKYTKEHIDHIRKLSQEEGITNEQLTKKFNQHFGQYRTESSIAYIRSKHNIILNNARARALKGKNLRGSKPLGTERVRKGYVEVKVSQPNTWEQKHRHIWQEHNRQLKNNEVVIFLDNNKRNFDINNLEVITRGELVQLNYRDMRTENKDLTKAGLNVVRINDKANEMAEQQRIKKRKQGSLIGG